MTISSIEEKISNKKKDTITHLVTKGHIKTLLQNQKVKQACNSVLSTSKNI